MRSKPRRNHRRVALLALAWLCVVVITQGIARFGLVAPLELAFSDYWHRIAGVRAEVSHVSLVVIDDISLDVHKDDPLVFWTPHIAKAVEVLRQAGALVVGLDVMFSISPERWLVSHGAPGKANDFDAPFREQIASGQLVMVASAGSRADDTTQFLLPATEFVLAVPDLDLTSHLGLADLVPDPDSVVRNFTIAPQLKLPEGASAEGMPQLTLAALLAARVANTWPQAQTTAATTNGARSLQLAGREYLLDGSTYPIAYAGPPGHIPRVSFAALLAPDALNKPEVKALKGRVVIIGGEYLGMNDTHATPYVSGFIGSAGYYMTGPEVQANIVETLLSGRLPQVLPPWQEGMLIATLLLAALLAFARLSIVRASLTFAALALLSIVLSYAMFLHDLRFPGGALVTGTLLLLLVVMGLRFLLEERERIRIAGLFGRYVSDNVVAELIASGEPPKLGGERRTLTVLFSDIRNFTTLSEALNPEEVVEMLNLYFGKVCTEVLAEGGTIDKFIGDAIMVQFGAPVAYADHADRALRSALAIKCIAAEFAQWMLARFPDRHLPEFAIGVGLHSGPAVVGNIGSEQRTEYTVIGDTVNIASRIEGVTKELGCVVLASDETIRTCTGRVGVGKSKSVAVKGRSAPLLLHEVLEINTGVHV